MSVHVRKPVLYKPGVRVTRVVPRNNVLDGVHILQGNGQILGVVRPIEKHWQSLLQCTHKWLNRSRCCLVADLCDETCKRPGFRSLQLAFITTKRVVMCCVYFTAVPAMFYFRRRHEEVVMFVSSKW